MSIFNIPDIVTKNFISIERRFIGGSSEEKRKLMTLRWDSLNALKMLRILEFWQSTYQEPWSFIQVVVEIFM